MVIAWNALRQLNAPRGKPMVLNLRFVMTLPKVAPQGQVRVFGLTRGGDVRDRVGTADHRKMGELMGNLQVKWWTRCPI